MTALFFDAGYCTHPSSHPRITVCRNLLARGKLEDSIDSSGYSSSTQCLDMSLNTVSLQTPEITLQGLEFGVILPLPHSRTLPSWVRYTGSCISLASSCLGLWYAADTTPHPHPVT